MKIRDISVIRKTEKIEPGSVPYVEIGDIDIFSKKYSLKDKPSVAGAIKGYKGEILVSTVRPTRGAITILNEDAAISSAFVVLHAREDVCLDKFLFYCFNSAQFLEYLGKNSKGATYPTCSKDDVFDYNINEIDLDEQGKAVQKLDSLSEIIQNRKQELLLLDDLIKARFVEMFDSTDFPQVPISNLVFGKIPSVKKNFSINDKIKYIDISSIDNKRNVITGYTEYVLSEAPSRAQQHIIKGDIVISTVRPNLKNIAMIEFDDGNLVASSGFCVLRPSNCVPEYLMAIVCSDKFTNDMVHLVTGANYPAIKDSDIMDYLVSLPTIELQNQFADFVKQVDKSKIVVQKALDEAQLLFDSLMQEYFG